ncbi:MAG: hypothetical protein JSW27_06210 [Phycisphaerales bacterium]|nr:MAG: hypothetical protein JSW27_06210 [Phycisphaerales bacterium]
MRGLKICLWIAGIGCLASVVGLVLPLSAWERITAAFGIDSLPDSPEFMYVARLLSAMSAATGVFLIILALDPLKYGVIVPFTGVSAICLGVLCGVAGSATTMPAWWYLGDALSCLVLGALMLLFWRQAKQAAPTAR